MECLHAAVRAGANAVYLGAGHFNARRGAENFTLETLAQACDYAHLRGVKIYLTLNTIVLPSEQEDALELARQAFRAGVDAFIVQDTGIALELARTLPQAEVHISTQMNIHDVAGLRAAAALGATRVTLARELSLEEISVLAAEAQQLGLELEAFAHGALCICYSGQCFMSSMVGGRSANRGKCAQACRLPYTLHNRALRKNLPSPGDHLLSPKDLCTVNLLPELIDAGVVSLKVEGRMKSPEYVQAVVGVYRAVLDRVAVWQTQGCAGSAPRATEEEMQVLSEAFSRGFTTAYLEGQRGNEIMSYGRPNNRGIFVGRVTDARNGVVSIAPETKLVEGDLIEFWTNRGHFVHTVADLKQGRGSTVQIAVEKPVGKGDRVFRVRSAAAAFVDDDRSPAVPVRGVATLRIGQPLQLQFSTLPAGGAGEAAGAAGESAAADAAPASAATANGAEPISVTVEGAVVEAARTKAVTADEVRDHIDRMGTTPFCLAELDVQLDEGVGIGFSALHKIRAKAAEQLQEAMLATYHDRKLEKAPKRAFDSRVRKGSCKVGVIATNPACARAAKRAGADFIYVPVANYRRGEALIAGQVSGTAEQAGYPKQCIPVLPTVSHMFDEENRNGFDVWKRVAPEKPVLVENIGQLLQAAEMGALPEVGPHIPVTNRLDVQTMHDMGAQRIWLSPELTLMQIEELGDVSPVPLGLTVIGYTELMVTEHCLLMSQGPCNQDCAHCARRKSPHYLKDRKGYEMTVVTDCTGRSHLYNAVQLDVAHAIPDLIHAGVSTFMVDTTLMNVAETSKAVARVVRARDIGQKTGDHVSKAQDSTSGHLFRGVS